MMDERWMADHVDEFASLFCRRYDRTGSLRESMMWAYAMAVQGRYDALSDESAQNPTSRTGPTDPACLAQATSQATDPP